jgi:predicted transcriptional regulator
MACPRPLRKNPARRSGMRARSKIRNTGLPETAWPLSYRMRDEGVSMDDCLKEALEIVKAQASVRNMTEEEISSMVRRLSESIRSLQGAGVAEDAAEQDVQTPAVDPKKAVRERSIICLESGKSFKILTKKHLGKFGLTPDAYREKWGYPKGMPLVCKELQRERRKKMKEMKLWEKRIKVAVA